MKNVVKKTRQKSENFTKGFPHKNFIEEFLKSSVKIYESHALWNLPDERGSNLFLYRTTR